MRVAWITVAVLAAVVALPGSTNASQREGVGPPFSSVAGTGSLLGSTEQIHVDATDASGPRGHFLVRKDGFEWSGRVDCLVIVTDYFVIVGGPVDQFNDGTRMFLGITDGEFNDAALLSLTSPGIPACTGPNIGGFAVQHGNFVVHADTR